MNIKLNSVVADDQERALRFDTGVPGFPPARTFQRALFVEDTCGNLINLRKAG